MAARRDGPVQRMGDDVLVGIGNDNRQANGSETVEIVDVVTDEGRSRFQRLFRGSTATEVVRKARTSVLDVR